MSALERSIEGSVDVRKTSKPLINRAVDFLSSVRLGVTFLIILVTLSMIGMLIVQQNVNGFDSFFASRTPAEKSVYGWLGFFDIYNSWYFSSLLLALSLNIILASIDRFPTAWKYLVKPKLTATRAWLLNQRQAVTIERTFSNTDEAATAVSQAFASVGLNPVITKFNVSEYETDEAGAKDFTAIRQQEQTVVFGQQGKWNRIGAYIVHVALLTLFLGYFVALRTGFDADVRVIPGQVSDQIQMIHFDLDKKERFNVRLPFTIDCLDIQQKLIDPKGSIDVRNTLDWFTKVKITDPGYGETVASISLNKPLSYRGYRFFQAQTIPVGNARTISLHLISQADGSTSKLDIPRMGSANLPDGTKVEYEEFLPDFTFNPEGGPDTRSGDYNNPAAVLKVTPANGQQPVRVFAFGNNIPDNIPIAAPKAGYKWKLASFEKAPLAHVLSIKYDPYEASFIAWYIGGFGLIGALIFVFFFSHRRFWANIQDNGFGGVNVILGGDSNRNFTGLEERFQKVLDRVEDPITADTGEDAATVEE